MIIRAEKRADYQNIRTVNIKAFGSSSEADIVDRIRLEDIEFISLVAERDGKIVGHILFSPVTLEGYESELKLMGLGPMAVLPESQNKGIGSKLVSAGLKVCGNKSCDAVVVLGHPNYYPRFGFRPSIEYGIICEYDVPDDTFMVKELNPGVLKGKKGTIKYHPLFNEL